MNMYGNNSFLYSRSGSTIVAPCFPIILPNGWGGLKVEAEGGRAGEGGGGGEQGKENRICLALGLLLDGIA